MQDDSATGFRRVRYSSADGTTYRSVFQTEYGGTEAEKSFAEDTAHFEYTIAGDEDVSLRTLDAGGGTRRGTIGPRADHVIFWLGRGSMEMRVEGETRLVLPGVPWIASASRSYEFESEDTHYNGIHISDAFLRDVASRLGLVVPGGDLVFEQQDDRIAALAPLRTLMREAGPLIGSASTTPALRRATNRRVAMTVLETFPLRAGGQRVGEQDRLAAAVSYIQSAAAHEVSVLDIARETGIGERSLQQHFRRGLGLTPMAYLRQVRLERAHDDLLRGTTTTTSVSAVARSWRLNHLGRFSSAYRERFDELPLETLRRR
ncbi:HTH-type transcriptional activator RhaS [Frondihabitans sp. 762G35]|uniref:helix-turn-helix domain-containing protein n=1 Tax=Frondihabitans sp. 762G35 TaxID=1446794 RepID=UPI000D224936|nr:helix-turn-helix domain-containing protein [Frondihabitans sp. 762G35]ARC56062.1 HTH-type transcriptional activator RhaS [Frondihabitans sp. 762G35]